MKIALGVVTWPDYACQNLTNKVLNSTSQVKQCTSVIRMKTVDNSWNTIVLLPLCVFTSK